MIHIAIVEDDAAERERLCALAGQLARCQGASVQITPYADADELLRAPGARFDLILLDIQMPGTDGMTAARRIRETDEDVLLVFITSMAQYALQGYQVNALDFLVKPVSEPMLAASMQRALRRLEKAAPACLHVKIGASYRRLNVSDVLYAETLARHVILHTPGEAVPYPGSLAALEKELAPHGFFRCHSAFVVNLSAVERIQGSDAFIGGQAVPVSKHRRKEFLSALTRYLGEKL